MLCNMSAKAYQVRDVARLARVTVRTLHHYDSIGLLVPAGRTEAGYRLYSEEDLLRLQQILVCRELGIPLEQIRRILDDPGLDRCALLLDHRGRLLARVRSTKGLAEMYGNDPRFQAAFDRHGRGMASFVADAIRANTARLGE